MLAGNAAYDPSAFFLIASATPTGTTVSFTSIPQTYKVLQLRIQARTARTGQSLKEDDIYMRFNSDATAGIYNTNYLFGEGGGNVNDGSFSAEGAYVGIAVANDSASGNFGCTIINVENYTNTTTFKPYRAFQGVAQPIAPSGSYYGRTGLIGGMWRSTSAITTVGFYTGSGQSFVTGTTFSLYGIKG